MNASEVHYDVASYALGILEPADVDRFEEHLVTCDACAMELESLLPVTRLLAGVDRDAFQKTSQSVSDGMMFDRMRNVVAFERKRGKARLAFMVAAAAAVAVIATLALSIALIGRPGSDGGGGTGPGTNNQAGGRATVGAPSTTAGPSEQIPGLNSPPAGGGNLPLTATDPLSGATMSVSIDPRPWGSQLSVTLGNIHGPVTCTLQVIDKSGHSDNAGSWVVSAEGYGTAEHPEKLSFTAATSISGPDISRIEVRAGTDVNASTLVSVKA
jgi:Putative zinc-finger